MFNSIPQSVKLGAFHGAYFTGNVALNEPGRLRLTLRLINKALRPTPLINMDRTNKKYRIKICMFLQAPSEIYLGRGLLTL